LLDGKLVEGLTEKLDNSDCEVSEDEPEPYQPSFKDSYDFHNGI